MSPRKSTILTGLERQGLPAEFYGKPIDQWSVHQLKKFVQIFSPESSTVGKKDVLCYALVKAKQSALTPHEESVLAAVLKSTKSVQAAQAHLVASAERAKGKLGAKRECTICHDAKALSEFPKPSASQSDHSHWEFGACTPCWGKWVYDTSRKLNSISMVTCPEKGCNAILNETDMKKAWAGLIQWYKDDKKNLPSDLVQRYKDHIGYRRCESQEGYVECCNPGCSFAGALDDVDTTDVPDTFTCPACARVTCSSCKTLGHPGIDHSSNLTKLQAAVNKEIMHHIRHPRTESSADLRKAETVKIKKCANPNASCQVLVIWEKGCPNVRCGQCHFKFCWWCEREIVNGACDHPVDKECAKRLDSHVKRIKRKMVDEDLEVAEYLDTKAKKKERYLLEWGRKREEWLKTSGERTEG